MLERDSRNREGVLTVLLATKNRAQLLSRVLESFCSLETPDSGWKLVVVDNGSTDESTKVLESFRGRLPLQALIEANPGKNSALNAGLRFIEGDLTVLTDDDVFPRSDWLVQLRKAANAHPEFTMFGGQSFQAGRHRLHAGSDGLTWAQYSRLPIRIARKEI